MKPLWRPNGPSHGMSVTPDEPPDDRDLAAVRVLERLRRLAVEAAQDRAGGVRPALDRALGDAGDRPVRRAAAATRRRRRRRSRDGRGSTGRDPRRSGRCGRPRRRSPRPRRGRSSRPARRPPTAPSAPGSSSRAVHLSGTDWSSMPTTFVSVRTVTPSRSSWRRAEAERSFGYGGRTRSIASTRTIRASGRVDRAEVALQGVVGDLAERAGQLYAGRAAADDDERHPFGPALRVGFPLGRLEGDEDPPPDLQRVVDRLEARRVASPTRRARSTSGARPSRR